jgi:hypothetical protein
MTIDLRFFHGLVNATPLSLALWAALVMMVIQHA